MTSFSPTQQGHLQAMVFSAVCHVVVHERAPSADVRARVGRIRDACLGAGACQAADYLSGLSAGLLIGE